MKTNLLVALTLGVLLAQPIAIRADYVSAQNGLSYVQPSFVGFASAFNGATSVTVNKPAGTLPGHLMVWSTGVQAASLTVTPPGGWTVIRNDSNGSIAQASYYKIAGSSEPSNYTFTLSAGGNGFAGIVTIANFNASNPIDATSLFSSGNALSATVSAPITTTPADLNLILFVNGGFGPQTLTSPAGIQLWLQGSGAGEGAFFYRSATSAATITAVNNAAPWVVTQVAIAPLAVAGSAAVRDQPMGFSALAGTGAMSYSGAANPVTGFSLDGCFNPVAYGADPSGLVDSSSAFNAATAGACAASGKVCIPPGSFAIASVPWIHQCTSSGFTPDIVGAGRNSTTLLNQLGAANGRGGGPALEIVGGSQVVTSLGGAGGAGLFTTALVGSGNSFFPTNLGSGPITFNLNEAIGNQPINGLAQLDVRGVINTSNVAQFQCLSSSDGSATPIAQGCQAVGPTGSFTCKGAYSICLGNDGKLYGSIKTSTTGWTGPASLKSAAALTVNTTYQVELSYDGSNVRLYHGAPNATMTMDAKIAQTGTIVQRADETMVLDGHTQYWLLQRPEAYWQGKIDTFEVSNIARCINDSGCTATNAKFAGDSNTVFLENWSNVANLPEVGPERTKGVANGPGPKNQSWMTMHNMGLGFPGGYPTIRDFSIAGGNVGIQANVVAPQIENVSSGASYGFLLDQINDYSSSGTSIFGSSGVVNWVDLGGLDQLTNFSFTCGIACVYGLGPLYSHGLLLPPNSNKWGMIFLGAGKIDSIQFDSENGGTNTPVLFTFMANNAPPMLEIDSSGLSAYGVAPITLDGSTIEAVSVKNSNLSHVDATRGPIVDGTNASNGVTHTVLFENNRYDNSETPVGGNTYSSAGVAYQVNGGITQKRTTLNGTTSGTAVWAQPGQDSADKKFTINLAAYLNNSGASQTITYPAAFAAVNDIVTVGGSCTGITTNLTTLTLPNTMGGASLTGRCEVRGY